ncbi:hypothetical protein MMC26_006617 [Xylographa opegraphella]|nr:hypothetical protein [Xylographa opegraphella]
METEGSTPIVAEPSPRNKKAHNSPQDAGNLRHPPRKTVHPKVALLFADEAGQDLALPSAKRDPYKIEVVPVCGYKHGYPQLAAFVGCDPNFAIYRQFKTVRHRCLLYMQDELRALEHELEQMDLQDSLSNPRLLSKRSSDAREDPPRRMQLIAKIRDKMHEYGGTKKMMQLQPPTERNRRSYVNYINNEQPTVERERTFIQRSDDLITLAGNRQNSWLYGTVERLVSITSPRLATAVFQDKVQTLLLTGNEELRLFDKTRFDALVRFVVTCSITVLILTSTSALPLAQQAAYGSEVILLLTGSFASLVALFTDTTRGELFAATVGYYAVLVVTLHSSALGKGGKA